MAGIGIFAGIVNTLAGGGSLITLPVLILLGLPADVANGTNRIGVVIQSVAAGAAFHRRGVTPTKELRLLLPATCIGAVGGAWASVSMSAPQLQILVGLAMPFMLIPVLIGARENAPKSRPSNPVVTHLTFLMIGFYGGLLQAGVGVLLLLGITLCRGIDLVAANAVKVLLVALFTLIPLVLFIAADLVSWGPALSLALGSALGGWLGARITLSWGAKLIRIVLIVVVLGSASHLLGFSA